MQFKFTQFIVSIAAFAGLANAAPAPSVNATTVELSSRLPHAGTAWEHTNFGGSTYGLSDHGDDCVVLVKSWEDRWSTVKVLSGYTCSFHRDRACSKYWWAGIIPVPNRSFTLKGPTSLVLPGSNQAYMNDRISAYNCAPTPNCPSNKRAPC